MIRAAIFDFHNTLATCDAWLELEIKTLPSLAIEDLVARGTLAEGALKLRDTAVHAFRNLRQSVRESGVELSAVEGTQRVLHSLELRVAAREIEEVVGRLEEALLPSVEPVAGAAQVLEELARRGLALGVVSSAGYPRFVEMSLERLDLRGYFSVVVTSTGEGVYKSDPEIFSRTVRYLGVEPGEAVHVGDHPVYDVQTARLAGLKAVWFAAHSQRTAHLHSTPWAELAELGLEADAIIHDLLDLPAALRKLS